MTIFDNSKKEILDGLRQPTWEIPVDPEGAAAYWCARAEAAEAEAHRLALALFENAKLMELLGIHVSQETNDALAAHDARREAK